MSLPFSLNPWALLAWLIAAIAAGAAIGLACKAPRWLRCLGWLCFYTAAGLAFLSGESYFPGSTSASSMPTSMN